MTQELEAVAPDAIPGDDPTDPIALARLFCGGRSLKRGATIQMVRELLAEIDAAKREFAAVPVPEPTAISSDVHLPSTTAYWSFAFQGRSPVIVQAGAAGAVFLLREAARWYTRDEAVALAHEILRASKKGAE